MARQPEAHRGVLDSIEAVACSNQRMRRCKPSGEIALYARTQVGHGCSIGGGPKGIQLVIFEKVPIGWTPSILKYLIITRTWLFTLEM